MMWDIRKKRGRGRGISKPYLLDRPLREGNVKNKKIVYPILSGEKTCIWGWHNQP